MDYPREKRMPTIPANYPYLLRTICRMLTERGIETKVATIANVSRASRFERGGGGTGEIKEEGKERGGRRLVKMPSTEVLSTRVVRNHSHNVRYLGERSTGTDTSRGFLCLVLL